MPRRAQVICTAEFIVLSSLFSLVCGAMAGAGMGLLLNSIPVGLLFFVLIMLFCMDIIFEGARL